MTKSNLRKSITIDACNCAYDERTDTIKDPLRITAGIHDFKISYSERSWIADSKLYKSSFENKEDLINYLMSF